ncbi:MAG: hypothetical protein NTY36_03400 [Deltaproteobacteria bacterium]|nr:hypothetical protein [Deltaproteobacteria bacterium]
MEELLFGLTPAEWWAWCYLVLLAQKQGSTRIILPRPGEDSKAEKIFCRKHLKNLLKSLKAKRHLTNLIFPRTRNRQVEIFLPASMIGELGFLKEQKGVRQFSNNRERSNPSSPIKALGNHSSAIEEVISTTLPESSPAQAKLKDSLKTLVKQKQGELIKQIMQLRESAISQMRQATRSLCGIEAKGQSLSNHARLYATIRFLQETGSIEKPQAWMTTVARRGQEAMEAKWSEGRSGSVGRSPSREGYGGG